MTHTKKRILVMEDDPKITAALAIRLTAAGYEVLTAPDGFIGLKLALDQQPDLVLMDIWMPVGIGFSVAQRLQRLGLGEVPKIFITASKVQGLRDTAEKLGAVAFFEKPYDPTELLGAIALALEAREEPELVGHGE
jgi:two-component system KDP operon response regulator KdpE